MRDRTEVSSMVVRVEEVGRANSRGTIGVGRRVARGEEV